MKPYCDRPHCTRTRPHQHVEGPDTPSGASVGVAEGVATRNPPGNGTGAQGRSAGTSAPPPPTHHGPEVGGASPEVETGDGDKVSEWRPTWEMLAGKVGEAEADLERLRRERLGLLRAMRKRGLTLAEIAAVTGISRQRVGQLLR